MKFHGIAVKPGKPTLFATIGHARVWHARVSDVMPVERVHAPASISSQDCAAPALVAAKIDLPLARKIVSSTDRHQFYTVRIADDRAEPAFKASGDITSMAHADGYIEIPAKTAAVEAGKSSPSRCFSDASYSRSHLDMCRYGATPLLAANDFHRIHAGRAPRRKIGRSQRQDDNEQRTETSVVTCVRPTPNRNDRSAPAAAMAMAGQHRWSRGRAARHSSGSSVEAQRRRAEGESDAHLAPASRQRLRKHSVHAKRREQDRHRAETD